MSKHQRMHDSAARYSICPKRAPVANYVCVKCCNRQWNKPFAICGPKSGRACIQIHQMNPLCNCLNLYVTALNLHVRLLVTSSD